MRAGRIAYPVLTLEGRPVEISWSDGEAMWVGAYGGPDVAGRLRYRSARQILAYDLAARLPRQLGLPAGAAPAVPDENGWLWFHWLGDLYGSAVYDLLRYTVAAQDTAQPGLALALGDDPRALPSWTLEQVRDYVQDNYRQIEPLLDLGPFHRLLPSELRRRAVVELFNIPRFLAVVEALRVMLAPEALAETLHDLLD